MIDLLLSEACTPDQLKLILSRIFACPIDRVKVFSVDEFNSLTEELDGSIMECVCVHSIVLGDASQLLQLYRYAMPNSELIDRLMKVAIEKKIRCFIPVDQWNGWIHVNEQGKVIRVSQLEEDEEDCFRFKRLEQ